jgi:hypothetical protein
MWLWVLEMCISKGDDISPTGEVAASPDFGIRDTIQSDCHFSLDSRQGKKFFLNGAGF